MPTLLSDTEAESLMLQAKQASQKAYAPYSNFFVGAAVLTVDGAVFEGANIENTSYGLTNCAERVAIQQAVMAEQTTLKAIAVYGAQCEAGHITPCGACRQVISEFADEATVVVMYSPQGSIEQQTIQALLPSGFKL